MKVQQLKPATRLAPYVERVLVLEHDELLTPFALPLFANGSPTLLFTSVRGQIGENKTTHLTLFGQTVLPETLTLPAHFLLIAYFFKPYILLPVFGVPPTELTDKPIDLHLLAPRRTLELQERLLHSGSSESCLALLDDYIAGLAAAAETENSPMTYAADQIAARTAPAILTTIQKELHITERTFQRQFEKHIGLTPNQYRRICQFHNAFQQLNQERSGKLTDIAFRHGYADQSHYIRAFREFTHITPKDYLNFGA